MYKKFEFVVPEWSLCYFVNADSSGLTNDDLNKLYKFEAKLITRYGTARLSLGDVEGEDNLGFCHSNAIDNLGSNCYRLYLLVPLLSFPETVKRLISFYLDYTNNFLTVGKLAEHYKLSVNQVNKYIDLGRYFHERSARRN